MVSNDPLANVLSNVLNAEKVGKVECVVRPFSSMIKNVLSIMKKEGYIADFEAIDDGRGGFFKVKLSGSINKCAVIKPRFQVKKDGFEGYEKRFLPAANFGIMLVSTSKGLITHTEAKKNKIGGRLIAYFY